MATERTYTVPLRKYTIRVSKYQKAKRAVRGLKAFLGQHMKAEVEDVKLGKYVNLEIWKKGMQNPPPRIRVTVTKDDKGQVFAELVGAPKEEKKVEKKKKGIAEKVIQAVSGKKEGSAPVKKKKKPVPKAKVEEAKPEVKKETEKEVPKPSELPPTKTPVEKPKPAPVIKSPKRPEESVKESTSDLADSAKRLNELAKKKKI